MPQDTPLDTPAPSHAVPLTSQVGGHAGVMTSEDGSLLIKPAHPVEVSFYQCVGSEPGFAPLRPYIPKFFGTLKLAGQVDPKSQSEGGDIKIVEAHTEDKDMSFSHVLHWDGKLIECSQSIVLENLSNGFSKPNILDVKLGTVLYDDDAPPEKRERMEKAAKATTSFETGIRLTGFQVYDLSTGLAVNTPKSYGKSINPSQLSEGVARFFPIAPSDVSTQPDASSGAETSPEEKKATGTGLPATILLPILEYLLEDIEDIREAIASMEFRMVGGSLLIVYEADLERAKAGLEWYENLGIGEEDDDDDDDDEEAGKKRYGPPYLVKLIDFAHTKVVPGKGPDNGVLKGVDTVLELLRGRIEEVRLAGQ